MTDQRFILQNGQMASLLIIVFIFSGSITTMYFPEGIDTFCATPDQQWVENGTRYVGMNVSCP